MSGLFIHHLCGVNNGKNTKRSLHFVKLFNELVPGEENQKKSRGMVPSNGPLYLKRPNHVKTKRERKKIGLCQGTQFNVYI